MKATLAWLFADRRSAKRRWVDSYFDIAFFLWTVGALLSIPFMALTLSAEALWPQEEGGVIGAHPWPFFIGGIIVILLLVGFYVYLITKLENKLRHHYEEDEKWGPPPQE